MNIGQAAKASGVNAKLIRYYESIGLIPEAGRTATGYRVYTPTEVNVLRFVKRARSLGFPLERIQLLVSLWQDKSRASADVKRIALEHVAELERKIAELRAMSDTLRDLADACHGDRRPDCPILSDLAEAEPLAEKGPGDHRADRAKSPRERHPPSTRKELRSRGRPLHG